MTAFKKILFILVLLLMLIPFIQNRLLRISEKPLRGMYQFSEKPELKLFTWAGWFSGEFQEKLRKSTEDNIGFKKTLIRIFNQIDFSLFKLIHAEGFIAGKKDFLFEEDYIHEYTGKYFIGKETINKKLSRLKEVQQELKSRGTTLLLVLEPGKASFYPEFIPSRYHPENRSLTNYDYLRERALQLELEYLDLNRYFLSLKDTSRYPIFSKYGMHWSIFGVYHAIDTISRHIEANMNTVLPGMQIIELVISDQSRGSDYDIGEMMNVIFRLPATRCAYPEVRFDTSRIMRRLSVLVIADSYYLNIVDDYGKNLFRKQQYWYYNNRLYPFQDDVPPTYVDKTNLMEKLAGYDVILLMTSEINLHCGFWNFADEAWLAFHPDEKEDPVYRIENEIRNERSWFRFLVRRAEIERVPLETMIRQNAEYVYYSGQNR
ncbi:MAG: hypothetical protein WCO93_06435 [bacterium]